MTTGPGTRPGAARGVVVAAGLLALALTAGCKDTPDGPLAPGGGGGGGGTNNGGGDGGGGAAAAALLEVRALGANPAGTALVAVGALRSADGGASTFWVQALDAQAGADTGFGPGGVRTVDLPGAPDGGASHDGAEAVLVLADGRILVAGSAQAAAPGARGALGLVRLTAAGALDGAFGDGGVVVNDYGGRRPLVHALALTDDGRLYVAATAASSDGEDWLVARYLTTGQPDTTFGSAGAVTVNAGSAHDWAQGAVVQPGIRLVVLGGAGFRAARLDTAGLADPGFGPGSTGLFGGVDGGAGFAAAAAARADGRLLMAGVGPGGALQLVQLTVDGLLDASFGGSTGVVTTEVPAPGLLGVHGLAVDASGRTLVYGASTEGRAVLLRTTTGGALDPAFGTGGVLRLADFRPPVGRASGALPAGVLAAPGAALVVRQSTAWVAGAPLEADGGLAQGAAVRRIDLP